MKELRKTKAVRPNRAEAISKLGASDVDAAIDDVLVSSFKTPLGWIGVVGQDELLISVFAGYPSIDSLKEAMRRSGLAIRTDEWNPSLRKKLEAYCEGDVIDFSDVQVRFPATTAFRRQTIAATRRIAYGETASYGELARQAGHPGAARAVGSVMSSNRFPIVIPCHRVIAAGGKLGGYSSPAGICLKERLLEMEARSVGRS